MFINETRAQILEILRQREATTHEIASELNRPEVTICMSKTYLYKMGYVFKTKPNGKIKLISEPK